MHTDFHQRILAEPNDVGPRLVYADWLEEQGDPRGEFIRVQCALADMPADDSERPALAAREKKLLTRAEGWLTPLRDLLGEPEMRQNISALGNMMRRFLPGPIGRMLAGGMAFAFPNWMVVWKRGFPEHLQIDFDLFLEHADAIADAIPLASLSINGLRMGRGRTRLADLPAVRRLSALSLVDVEMPVDEFTAMVATLAEGPLRQLALWGDAIPTGAVAALADSRLLPRLTHLEISRAPAGLPTDELLGLLATENLRHLTLAADGLDATAIHDLSRARGAVHLETLDLRGNELGNAVALAITHADFPALRLLNLSECHLGDPAIEAFAADPLLRHLHQLLLADNSISARGALALADSPHFQGRTRINLERNPIAVEVRRALRLRFGEQMSVDGE